MPPERPDDVPGDPDALQIHLSLDHPSGQRVAYLRDYYCDNPTRARDARVCLDMCNEYIEFTIKGCWVCGAEAPRSSEQTCDTHGGHRQANGAEVPIDLRPVDALDAGMAGVWLVATRGSTHIWDLDNMTYTRHPGPSSGSGSMLFDGNAMPITRVSAWPTVGESFFVWFDDPEDPDLLEHYRISSMVRHIQRYESATTTTEPSHG